MIDTERIITAEVHPTHPIFREAIRILQAETINIERDSGDTGTVHESINILNRPGNQNFDVWDNFLPPLNNSTYQYEFRQATDIQVSSFVTSLQVNILLFLILLALYEIFSRLLPSVYQCRSSEGQDSVHLPKSYLPLNWVPSIFRVSWAQVRKNCGMDNYFFLRYVRMVLQISAVSGLWGLLILWPIFATGGNNAHGWYYLSMANLQNGSWKLWFPTIYMWILTFYVCKIIKREYQHYVDCRMEFLAKGDSHTHPQQRYTLLVEEVPKNLRSDQALFDYFQSLFPGKIHAATIIMQLPDLKEIFDRREKVLSRLEKCHAIHEITGKRPVHKVGSHKYLEVRRFCQRRNIDSLENDTRLAQTGERVDSINYFSKYMSLLNERVREVQIEKQQLAKAGDTSVRASEWLTESLGLSDRIRKADELSELGYDGLIVASKESRGINAFSLVNHLGIDFFISGFTDLHHQIDLVVANFSGTIMSSTGFVTFSDLVTLTCAVRAPLSHEAGTLQVQLAPGPADIEWSNAHVNQSWSTGREWTANMFLGFGALLWSIPVTGVQALANLNSLSQIPGMNWILRAASGDFAIFLNGYLPVLALLMLISLLPVIFGWIASKYELRKSYSDVQHSIMKRFFYYQLANVYITVTAGSILDGMAEILDHPSRAFEILGQSVPTVVGYFVLFIMTKLLAVLPLVLLRVLPLLRRCFLKLFCRESFMTQRELDNEYVPTPIMLGTEYPNQLLVVVIVFTYAPIAPVILPIGALYFFGAYLVYKTQLVMVYDPQHDSGGVMFPSACQRTLIGLICGQITLLGYTVLRLGFYQPMFLLPLPIYTCGMMKYFKLVFEDPARNLSVEVAVELDKSEALEFNEGVYRQPTLVVKDLEPMPYRRLPENLNEEANAVGAEKLV